MCVIFYVLPGVTAEAYPRGPSKKNFCEFFPGPKKGRFTIETPEGMLKKGENEG